MTETPDLEGAEESLPTGEEGQLAEEEGLQEDSSAEFHEEEPEEEVTSATHLDEQLDEQLDDGSGDDSGEDSGLEEALLAWAEGGHPMDELDDSDEVAAVQFAQLDPQPARVKARESRLHNVEVDVTVELGRKDVTVRELVAPKEQDYIELDKLAGEAFTVLINGRPFAEGEIVVVTDIMALRITRLYEVPDKEEEGA